jgi:hypothetical protein
VKLTAFAVDDCPHDRDGLVLRGWDGDREVIGFISRRVMAEWVDLQRRYGRRKSLFRKQYNALGRRNLAAIERIVTWKYQQSAAFNRGSPVDVLLSDISECGEMLDVGEVVREPPLPAFGRL